ncbi:MAG: hypothetical protein WEC34_08450 [Acidimicrobiia bacterium]
MLSPQTIGTTGNDDGGEDGGVAYTTVIGGENGILAIAIDHPCAVPVVELQPTFTG